MSRLLAWALLTVPLAGCGGEPDAGGEGERVRAPVVLASPPQLFKELAARKGAPFVLNFWATWCGPCVEELPDLMQLGRESGVQILGVSYDAMTPMTTPQDGRRRAEEYLHERGYDFPTFVYDAEDYGAINEFFARLGVESVSAIPITLLFDAQGNVVDQEPGKAGIARFREMLEKLEMR